jgi:hypothetical protein
VEEDKHGGQKFSPTGAPMYDYPKYSDQCVNDYARTDSGEDFAESMVAALKKSGILYSEKLNFLQERFLKKIKSHDKKTKVSSVVKRGEDVELPKLPVPFKYKLEKSRIRIIE